MRVADMLFQNIEKNANHKNIAWFKSIIEEEYDKWKISKEEYGKLQEKIKAAQERLGEKG